MPKTNYLGFPDDARDLNQAKKAYQSVSTKVGKANAALVKLMQDPHGSKTEEQRFTTWFGDMSKDGLKNIQEIVHNMSRQLTGYDLTFEYRKAPDKQGIFAWIILPAVRGLQPNGVTIYLANQFFVAANLGENSQVGTIIHELTHLVGNTNDTAYGQAKCKKLATTAPADAKKNADSFEFYIESFSDL